MQPLQPSAKTSEPAKRRSFRLWFGKRKEISKAARSRRSDIIFAASGTVLGLTCALFPWYIFLNPEKFGPPVVKFEGTQIEASGSAARATPLLPRGEAEVRIVEIPDFNLDYGATGSLRRVFSQPEQAGAEQPYPDDQFSPFTVIHVTAGRAMIEDDSGIWVVQRGSTLPDRSRVEKIEKRGAKWVVVTSEQKVLSATD